MKAKKPLLVLLVILTLLAVMLIVPGTIVAEGHHTQHYAAAGVWGVYDVVSETEQEVGGYDLMSGTQYADWTGTFRGTSVEPYHGFYFLPPPDNGWRLLVTSHFKGSVYANGHKLGRGQADITITGVWDPGGPMGGTWTVASGKGGLKNLKGEGAWELSMTTFELVYTGEVWLE